MLAECFFSLSHCFSVLDVPYWLYCTVLYCTVLCSVYQNVVHWCMWRDTHFRNHHISMDWCDQRASPGKHHREYLYSVGMACWSIIVAQTFTWHHVVAFYCVWLCFSGRKLLVIRPLKNLWKKWTWWLWHMYVCLAKRENQQENVWSLQHTLPLSTSVLYTGISRHQSHVTTLV